TAAAHRALVVHPLAQRDLGDGGVDAGLSSITTQALSEHGARLLPRADVVVERDVPQRGAQRVGPRQRSDAVAPRLSVGIVGEIAVRQRVRHDLADAGTCSGYRHFATSSMVSASR